MSSRLEWNQAHLGDNLPILQQMVNEGIRFNLILTDPPYNVGKKFGKNDNSDRLERQKFLDGLDERFDLLSKLLTPCGNLLLFCSQLYVGDIQLLLRKEDRFVQQRLMIWHYENGMSRQVNQPVTEFEPFWWFSKSDCFTYNLEDVRVPYKTERVKNPVYKKNAAGDKIGWLPNPNGRKRGDVWKYPTLAGKKFENEKTSHPTQKPLSLTKDLLRAFSWKNDDNKYECKVLDCYAGSGTTPVACEILNKEGAHHFTWMAIEKEQQWIDECNRRLKIERKRIVEPDIFA